MMCASNLPGVNPSEELQAVHKKREALLRVVKITRALERMQDGLQAVLLMGEPSSKTNKHMLQAYKKLGKKTSALSTNQLRTQLDRLDKLVAGNVGKILEIASVDEHQLDKHINHQGEETESVESRISLLIENFKRSAQTAVAMRVLLGERGVSTVAMNIQVSDAAVSEQITALEKREEKCRHKIEAGITDIRESTQNIINSESASDDVKAIASMIQENLTRDLNHIKAGKSIEDMPMVVEVVELKDDTVRPEEENIAGIQKESTTKATAQKQPGAGEPPQNTRKPGFFKKITRWISTPMNVRWKDID